MAKRKSKSKIEWEAVEGRLYQLTVAELKRVGEKYKGEPFYGFAFDVNADYGDVLLCVNTETALQKSASAPESDAGRTVREHAARAAGRKIKLGRQEIVAYHLKKLRWALGDWAYQGFASEAFDTGWSEFQEMITTASVAADPEGDDLNPISQRFLISVCKVMTRLEKEKAFTLIPTTRNFKTWVGDHDELDTWSIARLKAVRNGKEKVLLKSWQGTREVKI